MAKIERLMQVSSLIKKREAVSVKELSRACGVSQRTIYRYLNTLSKLGTVNFGLEAGVVDYRRDDSWSGLSRSEMDIIDFCLRHNPLTRFPFFVERLSRLRRKVREGRIRMSGETSYFVLAEDEKETIGDSGESDVLEQFIRAKADARKVVITFRESHDPPLVLIPRAVKIGRSGIALVVSHRPGDDGEEIGLAKIKKLEMSAETAKER